MFRQIKARNPSIKTKSGLMLGLGETAEELLDTFADLLEAGVEMLTVGQYLQPSPAHLPVERVTPQEFHDLAKPPAAWASSMWPAPFVRSSYHARRW